jgi:hypothetical protein
MLAQYHAGKYLDRRTIIKLHGPFSSGEPAYACPDGPNLFVNDLRAAMRIAGAVNSCGVIRMNIPWSPVQRSKIDEDGNPRVDNDDDGDDDPRANRVTNHARKNKNNNNNNTRPVVAQQLFSGETSAVMSQFVQSSSKTNAAGPAGAEARRR